MVDSEHHDKVRSKSLFYLLNLMTLDSILFYDVFFRSSQFLNALKRDKTQKDCL